MPPAVFPLLIAERIVVGALPERPHSISRSRVTHQGSRPTSSRLRLLSRKRKSRREGREQVVARVDRLMLRDRKFRRLFAGGRWTRTFGTAAGKPVSNTRRLCCSRQLPRSSRSKSWRNPVCGTAPAPPLATARGSPPDSQPCSLVISEELSESLPSAITTIGRWRSGFGECAASSYADEE
jgi:hypothetical protein